MQSVTINIKTPLLPPAYTVYVSGSTPKLGRWDTRHALPLTRTRNNTHTLQLPIATLRRAEYKYIIKDAQGRTVWENHSNRTYVGQATDGQTTFPINYGRRAGIVVPVFSLRSNGSQGVGDLGDLKAMTLYAASVGMKALQILPINDTTDTETFTDSYPYKATSVAAIHPIYTDLRQLPRLNDTEKASRYAAEFQRLNSLPQLDYEQTARLKAQYLSDLYQQEAQATFATDGYKRYYEENQQWLAPYARFQVLRAKYHTANFRQWPADANADGTPADNLYTFQQYILHCQLTNVAQTARENDVLLKGDLPIGISPNSVEAYTQPQLFNLDQQAGAPPDPFAAKGQNWGFPTYNWPAHRQQNYQWWCTRLDITARYVQALRIDHVLGFFRIWQTPSDTAVQALLGQFHPALPFTVQEILSYGFNFQEERFTKPFITDWVLDRVFHERANEVKEKYVEYDHDDLYRMRPEYDTQRKVEIAFKDKTDERDLWLRDGLYALISDVLFIRDVDDPNKFHPRVAVQLDFVYESLYDCDKAAFNRLYNDFFYRRHNHFWYEGAMEKLGSLVATTDLLVCAEDLGMVPDCVPWVMDGLKILSLEIQTMPKDSHVRFGDTYSYPYRSVCTFSTHDMATMRQWWDEDWNCTQDYYNNVLHYDGPAPHPMPAWTAKEIVSNQLNSPSMLCLMSIQDWLAIDENLRIYDPKGERINVPANPKHYWRYRMHLTIEQLNEAKDYNETIKRMLKDSGRL